MGVLSISLLSSCFFRVADCRVSTSGSSQRQLWLLSLSVHQWASHTPSLSVCLFVRRGRTMDPSKRICLKNLPDGVTKREIADLVRNRTGAQPHGIDLGIDAEGRVRHYAHFSCEGAKSVVEVLQSGVVMRNQTVYGFPAKPHYSFVIAEARRKRERAEETEKEEREAWAQAVKERALRMTNGGELRRSKVPKKTLFSVKPKYGVVASELAKKFRDAHRQQRQGAATSGAFSHSATAAAAGAPSSAADDSTGDTAGRKPGKEKLSERRAKTRAPPHKPPRKGVKPTARKDGKDSQTAAPPSVAPPPSPPPPSKEEKKLSGLQARLAALKAKLKAS